VQSTHKVPRLDGVLIENRRSVLALMKGGFSLEFVQHPETIDAWDPETDEGAAPPVPARPTSSAVETATIDSLSAVPGPGGVYLRIVVVEPISDDLIPMVRYRVKDAGGGEPGQWIEQSFPDAEPDAGLITLDTNPVIGDELYQVQAGFRATGGTKSTWGPVTPDEVETTIYPTAPAEISNLVATPGAGQVAFTYDAPDVASFVKARFYRNTVNDQGTATLVREEYGLPNAPDAWTNTGLSAGTYYYWITTVNSSNVESSGVASGAQTVT
jgi:hypothetical protein